MDVHMRDELVAWLYHQGLVSEAVFICDEPAPPLVVELYNKIQDARQKAYQEGRADGIAWASQQLGDLLGLTDRVAALERKVEYEHNVANGD